MIKIKSYRDVERERRADRDRELKKQIFLEIFNTNILN